MNKVLDISPYDAIVVGSGATGGIAALTLAEQGIKVLVIEAGPKISRVEASNYEPNNTCLLYTSPSPRDKRQSRMPSSA